jgi:hypothetical protein
MSILDKDLLRKLRPDIDKALATVASNHGVTLKTGKCTFDPDSGNFQLAVEGVVKGGLDKEAARYNALRALHPKLPPLFSEFDHQGKTYRIVGSNTTGTKIVAENCFKKFLVPRTLVESLCAK